jgi:hypothetical protein
LLRRSRFSQPTLLEGTRNSEKVDFDLRLRIRDSEFDLVDLIEMLICHLNPCILRSSASDICATSERFWLASA